MSTTERICYLGVVVELKRFNSQDDMSTTERICYLGIVVELKRFNFQESFMSRRAIRFGNNREVYLVEAFDRDFCSREGLFGQ